MRKPNFKHPANISSLSQPTVSLITCGYKEINQTYPNIDHIIVEHDIPPIAFNEGVQSSDGLILCFLDRQTNFISEFVLEDIVKIFLQNPELGGVYTDNTINGCRQYYPSYSYDTLQNVSINTPLLCRRETQIQFNPMVELYYYDALKTLGSHTILHHIPEALFVIDDTSN